MPITTTTNLPAYCRHRASGQAVVRLNGRDIYLGVYDTAASRAEYNRVLAEWLAAGRQLRQDVRHVTIAQIAVAFRQHARQYYRDADGATIRSVDNFDEAMRPLLKLYGRTPAAEFGPLKLKAVRQEMIAAGRVRTNINRLITRIRQVFKWAVENEMLPPSVFHGLTAVSGLRIGRSEAKESTPVKPVAVEHVEATIPHVSRQVAAMIRLQLLTGMRPGEVVLMRSGDIDTTGKLWIYRPSKHKNQVHGHARDVFIGPKAKEIIRPFLKPDLAAFIFSPADADRERREARHAARKTPLKYGNRPGSNRVKRKVRQIGDRYNVQSYYMAVRYGCDAAFPAPAGMANEELVAWRRDHRWHPHRLRHTAATDLRKRYGLEAAQVTLGHKSLSVTEIYAEKNVEAAMKIASEVG